MNRFLTSATTTVSPLSLRERVGLRGDGLSREQDPSPGSPKAMLRIAMSDPTSPQRGEVTSSSWQRLVSFTQSLLRRHAERGVEPHHLAVEIGIVDHVQRQRSELLRRAEPARERDRSRK